MACFEWLKHHHEFEVPDEPELNHLGPDPFIESSYVVGLRHNDFRKFLQTKDVALVMFYDPRDKECDFSRKHFAKAASKTKRASSAYAGVNCTENHDLCVRENVSSYPSFKLYARGNNIGFFGKFDNFLYEDMRRWVEAVPVHDPGQYRRMKETLHMIRDTKDTTHQYALSHLREDAFVESPLVIGLEPNTFETYLKTKDAALVMFYNPFRPENEEAKLTFVKAAKKTKRFDHAYAALDCIYHYTFCCTEKINALPSFRLYNKGKFLNEYTDYENIKPEDMKSWVESVPFGIGRTDVEELPSASKEEAESVYYENFESESLYDFEEIKSKCSSA